MEAVVHIECGLRAESSMSDAEAEERVRALLEVQSITVYRNGPLDLSDAEVLRSHAMFVRVADVASAEGVGHWGATLHVHVFRLCDDGGVDEFVPGGSGGGEEEVASSRQWELPSTDFDGLWGNLVFDAGVKERLVEYAATALLFAARGVSPHVVSVNRLMLLHGPPGTVKTSLCRAVAQKLSIRLGHVYPHAMLLEINAHSLFSRWFSESGKLVMRLFEHIAELVEDEEMLVMVLIDEVESLSASRSAAMGGAEPSDAIRVVNALLTQIDKLRLNENVLILTTSNITEAIDTAFIDRADVKQYIGNPNHAARYVILAGALDELMRVGLISPPCRVPSFAESAAAGELYLMYRYILSESCSQFDSLPLTSMTISAAAAFGDNGTSNLWNVADACEGLSGRALRKLPFQAHAFALRKAAATCDEYIAALMSAVLHEKAMRAQLGVHVGGGAMEAHP